MSQENVEIVRRGVRGEYLRGRSGDFAPYLVEWLDPEIEWLGPREFPDLAEPHYGRAGIRRYIETLFEAIEDYTMVPEEFIDAGGEHVLVFCVLARGGTRQGSGAQGYTHPTAHLWTIHQGKAIRMQSYWERSDAHEAAGLQE
jgi:ketosteroid isomerase-like protein